jgi:hypothetical protein
MTDSDRGWAWLLARPFSCHPLGESFTLTLDLAAEPYWLDLPRGVRVEIRPTTTAIMATASRRLGVVQCVPHRHDLGGSWQG